MAKRVYIRQNNFFEMHFTITVMLKIAFQQRIASAHDFWQNNHLMQPAKIDAGSDGKQLIY